PTWHVMRPHAPAWRDGQSASRRRELSPTRRADTGFLPNDRPPQRGWRSPDFPSALVLRGDGHRAPAVRRRAGRTPRDGQENDAGPASRFIAAPWGWRPRRGGPQRAERWRLRHSPAAPAAEPVAVPP